MKKNNLGIQLFPVMLAFFAMGAVDLVGIASNYVKEDFQLSDTMANLFPSMVFFWFFIFSVPTGLLMNNIQSKSESENEISGLMIMGIAGGAIFPLLMGVFSDLFNAQLGAVAVMAVLVAYFFFLIPVIHNKKSK